MSDRPISVGDLVMVIKPSHGHQYRQLGMVFVVDMVADGFQCDCGKIIYEASPMKEGYCAAPASCLKRIDPPADAISEDARKPVEEPA